MNVGKQNAKRVGAFFFIIKWKKLFIHSLFIQEKDEKVKSEISIHTLIQMSEKHNRCDAWPLPWGWKSILCAVHRPPSSPAPSWCHPPEAASDPPGASHGVSDGKRQWVRSPCLHAGMTTENTHTPWWFQPGWSSSSGSPRWKWKCRGWAWPPVITAWWLVSYVTIKETAQTGHFFSIRDRNYRWIMKNN